MSIKATVNGACVYDDYAHHPSELKNLLDMAGDLGYQRILLAFQPHTYTRTKALFDDFLTELSRPDLVFLAEIYAAREKNTVGISSTDLAERVTNAVYLPNVWGHGAPNPEHCSRGRPHFDGWGGRHL